MPIVKKEPVHENVNVICYFHGNKCFQMNSKKFETLKFLDEFVKLLKRSKSMAVEEGPCSEWGYKHK